MNVLVNYFMFVLLLSFISRKNLRLYDIIRDGAMNLKMVPKVFRLKIQGLYGTSSQKSSFSIEPLSKIKWFHGTMEPLEPPLTPTLIIVIQLQSLHLFTYSKSFSHKHFFFEIRGIVRTGSMGSMVRPLKLLFNTCITEMYLLLGYILGVLTHTTAWYRHWEGDESLK